MANFKNFVVLFAVYALFNECLCQDSQGKPHESQGGGSVPQGGGHEAQRGSQEAQGGPNVPQGGAHESQGGAHQTQERVRRQAVQGPGNQGLTEWTSCDFTAPSKISCYDCNTRVICKPIGGILKPCGPQRPFCNNGICSVVQSPECA